MTDEQQTPTPYFLDGWCQCQRCGHEWRPLKRPENIIACPRCHSFKWRVPKADNRSPFSKEGDAKDSA